jgi:predicted enzyme involved in methoxymalonyl-ACP biosynthesis
MISILKYKQIFCFQIHWITGIPEIRYISYSINLEKNIFIFETGGSIWIDHNL